MSPSRWSSVPAAAAAVALLLAGCGGDGDLSKAELVAKADAICAKADKELDGLDRPDSPEQLKEYATKASETAGRQVEELKALKPPGELKADWDKAMTLLDQQVGLARELAENAEDQAKLQRILTDGEKLNAESNAIAKKLGLKQCGD